MKIVILDETTELREKLKEAKKKFKLTETEVQKNLKKIKFEKMKKFSIIIVFYIFLNFIMSIMLDFDLWDSLMYFAITLLMGIIIIKTSDVLNYRREEDIALIPLLKIKEYILRIKKALKLNKELLSINIETENSKIFLKSSCLESFTHIEDELIDYIQIDCFEKTIKIPKIYKEKSQH